ncbi:MAG: SURF1 family protein [Methyloceanibacter sp.]|uniref:SURF1 family protein n=1 Tax=Methyloceanibacter sp. TaxID=1965321 RepID=UPI003D6CCEFF
MRTPGLIRLTIFALAALALLIGLGVWQLERLEWKEALIARIEARANAKPMRLDRAIALAGQGGNMSYHRVRAEGRFHHAREQYLYALSLDGKQGWHVVTPLETVDGTVVLVDRGFVPDALRDPSSRALGQIQEVVTVTGLVRTPESPSLFIPDNEPDKNIWFTRDLPGMARAMFPSGTVEVAPFFLEAEASEVPGGWPEGGQTRLKLVNNHLQYALTWLGLAVCLIAVYGVYVWGAYRGDRS